LHPAPARRNNCEGAAAGPSPAERVLLLLLQPSASPSAGAKVLYGVTLREEAARSASASLSFATSSRPPAHRRLPPPEPPSRAPRPSQASPPDAPSVVLRDGDDDGSFPSFSDARRMIPLSNFFRCSSAASAVPERVVSSSEKTGTPATSVQLTAVVPPLPDQFSSLTCFSRALARSTRRPPSPRSPPGALPAGRPDRPAHGRHAGTCARPPSRHGLQAAHPAAMAFSETILTNPMSPVRSTWVPPQNSAE